MNILIKLSTIVALIIAPLIAKKTNVNTHKELEQISAEHHNLHDHSGHQHHDGNCRQGHNH